MDPDESFAGWVVRDTNWSRAGIPMAAVLTLLIPLLRRVLGVGALSVFAQLPIYLVHQYEEYGHGAFKAYLNEALHGRGRLTDGNIFVINVLGVWGVDLAALYAAHYRRVAAGLVAPYLSIVNGLLHLGIALRTRRYNPGAWTGGLLLLPGGITSATIIQRMGAASHRDHARAVAGALLIHVGVILIILRSRPRSPDR